jgi:flagellin-like hook-associated protein FlgL
MAWYSARLGNAAGILGENIVATSDSRSRLTDVDVGQETSRLVRQQILAQAGMALAAQAKADATQALTLLGA